jgi:DNA topoisomerase-1
MPRLRRADCSTPGITRRRRGKGFSYHDQRTGELVNDDEVLDRIRDLAIPPAWRDVWICPVPNGHLQAVGVDGAGRKQYRYHDRWRERRDAAKFEKMLDFARALPRMRAVCDDRLRATDELTRDRVLACALRLLDYGFFRIGSESYAEENETYGLATIRREHISVADGAVTFDYNAKGGKQRIQSIVDPVVVEVVQALCARDGDGAELLAYRDDDGHWRDVSSRDINDELKTLLGEEFSAKDFRTWNATLLAAVGVAVAGEATSKTARKRAINRAVQEVAHYLGNTPAVAKKSYIDPRVFDRYLSGWTIRGVLGELGTVDSVGQPSIQGAVEQAVIDLLEKRTDSPAVEHVAVA